MNRYTNAVLTVIAVALVALAIENGTSLARADSGITHVAICNSSEPQRCASVGSYKDNGYPLMVSPAR
jgi:hypothetical protein